MVNLLISLSTLLFYSPNKLFYEYLRKTSIKHQLGLKPKLSKIVLINKLIFIDSLLIKATLLIVTAALIIIFGYDYLEYIVMFAFNSLLLQFTCDYLLNYKNSYIKVFCILGFVASTFVGYYGLIITIMLVLTLFLPKTEI